jgi:hypothetical protein
MRDVTGTVSPSLIAQLMQNKKMIMILGIVAGLAIYMKLNRKKGV